MKHAIGLGLALFTLCTGCSGSSDSSPPATTTTQDSSTTAVDTGTTAEETGTEDTSASADSTTTTDDTGTTKGDGGSKSDGGVSCGSDPTLHPPKAGEGVFCPGVGDGGIGAACAPSQICCDTPKGSTPDSSCIASGGTCPTTTPKAGSSWECDAPSQCGTGKVCCGNGTPTLRAGCTYEEVFPAKGTVCAASCSASQFIVCEAPGDCPSGKTCTAIKSGSKNIGYCK